MATPSNIRSASSPAVEGLNLEGLIERENTATVAFRSSKNGKTHRFKVSYLPAAWNDDAVRLIDRVNAADDAYNMSDYMNEMLFKCLTDWEMYNGDPSDGAAKFDITEELLTRLEFRLKSAIMDAIQEDMRPGETKR